jgi:hypothetical protein
MHIRQGREKRQLVGKIVLVSLIVATSAFGQQTNPPSQSTAKSSDVTLEDTLKYINKVFADNPPNWDVQPDCDQPSYKLSVSEATSEIRVFRKSRKCEVDQYYFFSYDWDVSFHQYNMDRKFTIVYSGERGSFVSVLCKDDAKCVRIKGDDSGSIARFNVYTSAGDETQRRLERAFLHLVELLNEAHDKKNNSSNDPFAH